MLKIGGHFNGTGAAVWICCGFVPDAVRLMNTDLSTWAEVYWDKTIRSGSDSPEGYSVAAEDTVLAQLTLGTGIQPYLGGDTLVSGSGTLGVGTTTYGEGVYLKEDIYDYRYQNGGGKLYGDGENTDIVDWTLDAAATYAGHFNDDVVGTYIGKGSPIVIDAGGRQYSTFVVSVTAATGSGASSVVLAYPVPAGKVRFIGGKFGYKPMIAGEITPAGFKCSYAFTDNDIISFTAEKWD